jgi:response regulator RpfG family c-di-GMP phosphodiesterase
MVSASPESRKHMASLNRQIRILYVEDEDDIEEARNAGAQAFLIKPVSFEEVEKAISELISGAHAAAFEAKRAEFAAIQEELDFRRVEIRRRMESANRRRLRAENNLLRLKAMDAYLAAGGTRGEFARLWVSLRSQVLR